MITVSRPLVRLLATAGLLAGCGGQSTSSRVEHPAAGVQDSVLAASRIPGASGVKRAMAVSDSANARRQLEDSIANSKP